MMKRFALESAFRSAGDAERFSSADKFGAVTEIRLPVDGKAHTMKLAAC
jgi:hypothetical protein